MSKTLEQISAEYSAHSPKSYCICGHQGDGADSNHVDSGPAAGHGMCTAPGCHCVHFRWRNFTQTFEKVLKGAQQ